MLHVADVVDHPIAGKVSDIMAAIFTQRAASLPLRNPDIPLLPTIVVAHLPGSNHLRHRQLSKCKKLDIFVDIVS